MRIYHVPMIVVMAAIVTISYLSVHPALNAFAQFSVLSNLKNEVLPTYLVRIVPGAAEKK